MTARTSATTASADSSTSQGVFDRAEFAEFQHEQVLFCRDRYSGLRAIIAVHSLALGPGIGGCRMYPYADEESALVDVLRLSMGMTFKAAGAGLNNGGAKAVIIGSPDTDKSPALFEAFGRFVEDLGGRYITAGDVGTNSDDMDIIGRTTRNVTFRNEAAGGSGDSGYNTAFGVLQAMRAGAEAQWGTTSLANRTVGVEGLGKVGYRLVRLLIDAGATVVATDVDARATTRARTAYTDVRWVDDVRAADIDIYAPCALGGTITPTVAGHIAARVICGGANNQLAASEVESVLADRGVTWVPDYLANAGGLIQAAAEVAGRTVEQARHDVEGILDTTRRVIAHANAIGVTTGFAANDLALQRIRTAEADRERRNHAAARANTPKTTID